jgi:hypothetical protein
VFVQVQLPAALRRFCMPAALDARLQELLDRQDRQGRLPPRDRREAYALAQVADMLSLLKLRTRRQTAARRT